jgi:hypothetical protein
LTASDARAAFFLVWRVVGCVGEVGFKLDGSPRRERADSSVTTGSMDASGRNSRFTTELRREICSGKCSQAFF